MKATERCVGLYKEIPSRNCRSGKAPGYATVFAGLLVFASIGFCGEAQQTGDTARPSVSLTLPKAVEMAMQHNRRLRLAQLSVDESKARETIAKSNYFPHITNQSTALYFTELQGVVIPAGAFGNSAPTGLIPGRTLTLGQGALDAFTSGTGLTQPLTQIFRIHAGDRAAAADVRMAQIDATDAENSTSLLVHKLYFDILTEQAQLDAAKESVAAARVTEAESARAAAEGRSLDVAVLQAHAAMLDQRQTVLTHQLSIDDSVLQLDDVIGLPLGTQLVLDGGSVGDPPQLPSRAEAFETVLAHNPKVLSAQQTVEKAKAGVAAARDAYIPDITGLARYSYQSGVPFLVHNFGSFGGAVTYDLFDGGARGAKLKQAKIQLEIAETQLQQTQSDIRIQISAAYDRVERLQELVSVVQEALKARTETARVSTEQVAQNSQLESAAAKDSAAAFDTKASLLEAQLGLFLAQNSIQQMMGERP
jgi:outer membrane protein TolC